VLSTLSEITIWVALLAVTASVEELPSGTVVGLATIVTVGAVEFRVTVTMAFDVAVPPGPVAVAV
jgi:hypothetical protein